LTQKVIIPVVAAYQVIKKKIADRRSDVDIFAAYMKNTYHTSGWQSRPLSALNAKAGFKMESGK